MPKSKRNKLVSLTKTNSKGRRLKEKLVKNIRQCADTYTHCFVIGVKNMRNTSFKEIRAHWKNSRFFFGKNKVMSMALGNDNSSEHKTDLHLVSQQITGARGLFFTNAEKEEVLKYFSSVRVKHFARSGATASEDYKLSAGPLEGISFAMEPQLRKLGLPTELKRGVVVLRQPVMVCRDGDELTPEQCKILELFNQPQALFEVHVYCHWSAGRFEQLKEESDDESDDDGDEMDDDLFA